MHVYTSLLVTLAWFLFKSLRPFSTGFLLTVLPFCSTLTPVWFEISWLLRNYQDDAWGLPDTNQRLPARSRWVANLCITSYSLSHLAQPVSKWECVLLAATRILICFRVAFETSLMSLLGVFSAYDRTPAFAFCLLHNQSNFYRGRVSAACSIFWWLSEKSDHFFKISKKPNNIFACVMTDANFQAVLYFFTLAIMHGTDGTREVGARRSWTLSWIKNCFCI